ncbi:SDR family oxidoreductase [Gracilibacillus xinjiangensis]|uniref:SDR family oxidoreductase n=1 Tax=Gracilibacillus xinjiangensis TaxID=1193282 RepID=A0ABV8WP76_9BACI
MNHSPLHEKVVVIIGASRGIGKATADLLSDYGTKLILGSRNMITSEKKSPNILLLTVDVSNEDSVIDFVNKSITHFGKIDVLINAAGLGTFSPVLESKTSDFDQMMNVNLRGTYLTCKFFGRQMKKQGNGQILNLISIAGTTALAGSGGYAASKFGLLGLTRVLQTELRGEGVRITSILPGAIDSSFWDGMDHQFDRTKMIPVQSIAKQIIFLINQPGDSVVDEIAIMPLDGIL